MKRLAGIGQKQIRLKWGMGAALAAVILLGVGASQAVEVQVGGSTVTAQAGVLGPVSKEPPLTASLRMTADKIQLGDPVTLEITLSAAPGVEELDAGDYSARFGDWDLLAVHHGKERRQAGRRIRTDQVTLAIYQPGEQTIPSAAFRYRNATGEAGEFRTAPLKVQVAALPLRSGDGPGTIRGMKPPQGMISWWWVGVAGLLAGLAGTGVWWWLKRQRQANGGEGQLPARPPEEIARERLDQLRARAWLVQGEFKPYYIELSDILRRYLEGRYQQPVMDWTTVELVRQIKQVSLLERHDLTLIRDILERSDFVKFAKAKPEAHEAETDWQQVSDFVGRTTPRVAVEGEAS